MEGHKRQKILIVSLSDSAGGAEQLLLMVARTTDSQIIFLKKASSSRLFIHETADKVRYLNSYSIFLGFLLLLKELVNYRSGFTIISSHPYLNAYLGLLKQVGFLKSQLITRECTSVFIRFSGFKRLTYKVAYLLGYRSINLLICQTSQMKVQLLENLSFLEERKVLVCENPVDLKFISRESNLPTTDVILGEQYICAAGRLIVLKGFDTLILAFSAVLKCTDNIKLLILGEGTERRNLESLIDILGLKGKVILKGFVNNPYPYYKNAKVCVVSSINEGFPNVLLQMMALNASVVSTRCAEGIADFETIRTVEVNNASQLAEAILQALEEKKNNIVNSNRRYILPRTPSCFVDLILSAV